MADQAQQANEIEVIPAEEARRRLEQAIRERLGDYWDDEETGWSVVARHDYMARLTRGRTNMDFYVDLLGQVSVEEKEINAGQEYGRIMAWAILLGSVLVAFIIAHVSGLF